MKRTLHKQGRSTHTRQITLRQARSNRASAQEQKKEKNSLSSKNGSFRKIVTEGIWFFLFFFFYDAAFSPNCSVICL
jgi:hypothetical protein